MSSANAFGHDSAAPHGIRSTFSGSSERRPLKRSHPSEQMDAGIRTRHAQTETSLEVDIMILDYIAYDATKACLNTPSDSAATQASLALVDPVIERFRKQYGAFEADAALRFRIFLLRFTACFTQRFNIDTMQLSLFDLDSLRQKNLQRTKTWIETEDRVPSLRFYTASFSSELPLSSEDLTYSRGHVGKAIGLRQDSESSIKTYYGTASCLSLLDILPLFMHLSAVSHDMNNSNVTSGWIELACSFMLHACLEQYLVYGAHGMDAIDIAFAWGYKPVDRATEQIEPSPDTEQDSINRLFEDEEDETESVDWRNQVQGTLKKLLGPLVRSEKSANVSIQAHLWSLTANNSFGTFDAGVRRYLSALADALPAPTLQQLENGYLDGMSSSETAQFLEGCGLKGPPSSFFEPPIGFKDSTLEA